MALALGSDLLGITKAKVQIEKAVRNSGARESWCFIKGVDGKFKPKVMFGGETKKVAEMSGETIFGKKNVKAVETYEAYKKVRSTCSWHLNKQSLGTERKSTKT